MSTKTSSKKSDTIPLSVAVTLVSYSRDYIGRLAREGKIVAEQIDREWFVSRQSLLNFAENTELEDSIKKRILSLSRKNDLEVKDFYAQRLLNINNRQSKVGAVAVWCTIAIMAGGLFSGYVFYTNAKTIVASAPTKILDTMRTLSLVPVSSQTAAVLRSSQNDHASFSNGYVIESNEAIAMDKGIVLFPTVNARDSETVNDLFSDDVTVVVTGTTTGFVRLKNGTSELPFVRVPDQSSF